MCVICFQIQRLARILHENVEIAYKEANELMAIFLKSIETAKLHANS